ncbi:MAG: acetyl-CoA carboxylase biotin carboxyl carrier protein [Clostridiales bacterium]|nr:acetyl-CoA carboxylase biotin carboxyl carrier protein [Clostridiales bacterium]
MTTDEIKELIRMIDSSSLRNFELKADGVSLRMSKNEFDGPKAEVIPTATVPVNNAQTGGETLQTAAVPSVSSEPQPVKMESGNLVKSPIVGTFYASASPEKPPLVKVGDKVKQGDILCIVEAMKIMNEITSKFDGEIAEIYANNEDLVEFGQPLFRIV